MEVRTMRLLLIHADKFEYESKEKAVKEPESIPDHAKKGTLQDGLVVFTTVEKGDEQSPENTATNAAASIEEVLGWLKTNRVMIYPYAHLSTDLAGREPAIATLKILESKLSEKGYEVSRAPFGWYKSFTISAKGHPLSELSRTVTSQQQTPQVATQIKSEYMVMDENGELHPPETFQYEPGMKEFESLVEKEALKKGLTGGEPRFLEYARRFGIEWESYADLGQMRFGPESDMIIQLLSDYANQVIRRIGIPILNVRGTNIFEVADSYRMEQSGELLLSFRLRKFLMPDLHIYLKNLSEAIDVGRKVHERIYEEIRKIHREYVSIYNTTRSFFQHNKDLFIEMARVEKKPLLLNFVPEGQYYWVLNVEYNIIDDLDRPREIGTFQIDVGNAQRFGIHYANEKGEREYPVIIHTAVIGGLERYLFALLDSAVRMERQGKKPMLPVWVSPV